VKFKNRCGLPQLKVVDNEDVALHIDSYRNTPKDADKDYRFVVLLEGKTFGLSHKAGRKLAIAILKELSK
jgi:hypothetical protein